MHKIKKTHSNKKGHQSQFYLFIAFLIDRKALTYEFRNVYRNVFDNNSQNSDRIIMSVGIECKIFILRPIIINQASIFVCLLINEMK